MQNLITQLDLYLGQKAPALPTGLKEFLVKIAPFIVIIGLILMGLSIFSLIPLLLSGVLAGSLMMTRFWLNFLLLIVIGILELLALPGLFKRERRGWTFTFYALLASLLQLLINLEVAALVVSGLVGGYLLFQLRPYYRETSNNSDNRFGS